MKRFLIGIGSIAGILVILWLVHVRDPLLVSYLYPITGTIEDESGVYRGGVSDKRAHGWGTFTFGSGEFKGDQYVGEFKNGSMDGQGTLTNPNGERYDGEFKDGKADGQGTKSFSDESKYVGGWRAGNPWVGNTYGKDGNITATYTEGVFVTTYATIEMDDFTYTGEVTNGVPHGVGTFTFADGSSYVGEFKNGSMDGQGTLTGRNGEKYVGEYKNGSMDGQGTLTNPNGERYDGEFKDGKADGQGTKSFSDGSKYVGEFKNGSMDGQGTLTNPNGERYDGEFKDGKASGHGTLTLTNGDEYAGGFKHGKADGQGTKSFSDGSKYVGEFKNGSMDGQGTLTNPNGERYDGEFKDGKASGHGTLTLTNGDEYAGGFKHGKADGQGTKSFSDGSKYVGEFQNGKSHGQGTLTSTVGGKYVGRFKVGSAWEGTEYDSHGKVTGTYSEGIRQIPLPVAPIKSSKEVKIAPTKSSEEVTILALIIDRKSAVEVKDAFDRLLVKENIDVFFKINDKIIPRGSQNLRLWGTPPFTVNVSNPDGVRFRYNGKVYLAPGMMFEVPGTQSLRSTPSALDQLGITYLGGTYTGEASNGLPNGYGTLTLPDGEKYIGEWQDDKIWEGTAYDKDTNLTAIYSKGVRYEPLSSTPSKSLQKATIKYLGGTYTGEASNGLPNGYGTLTLPDGEKYIGEWQDDKIWEGTAYDKDTNITAIYSEGFRHPK